MKVRKFAAGLMLASQVLSLTPVFAAEENLDKREKILVEQAVKLSDKSVNLDDKEQELNKRSAKLEELEQDLRERNAEFSVRETELNDLRASLNKNSAYLDASYKEFEQDKEQFENYKIQVAKEAEAAKLMADNAAQAMQEAENIKLRADKRDKELARRENDIQDELAQLEVVRDALMASKNELDQQADEIEAKYADLKTRNEEADKQLAEINLKQEDMNKQLASLNSKAKKLEAARKLFNSEQDKLDKEKLRVDTLKADAEKAVKEAEKLMAEADAKSLKADEIINKSLEQENLIAQLKEDLAEKKQELDALYVRNDSNNVLIAELMSDAAANIALTPSDKGIINWSDGSIRARGFGVAPDDINNIAQAKALARRAAVVDLQRNLLETVQGVQIDSKTLVQDFMTKSDTVNTAVQGVIKGVEVIEERWDEKTKSYNVAGQIRPEKMSGAMSQILNQISKVKMPKEPKAKKFNYTGLIIDARDIAGLEHFKIFHIVDEKGSIVYGSEFADKNIQAKKGLYVYYDRMVTAKDEKSKVGSNPLVIKAQRIASNGSDIVILTEEADKIRANKINFRKDCRVIIVNS